MTPPLGAERTRRGVAPRIAVTLGDPAGIRPELVARYLATTSDSLHADIWLIGDQRELEDAMADAGTAFSWSFDPTDDVPTLVGNSQKRPDAGFQRRVATEAGGRWAMGNLRTALRLAAEGTVDGIVYAPLNKASMHLAGMVQSDEMTWIEAELGGGDGATELNLLPDLVTARVTSHCPIADVPGLITRDLVVARGRILHDALRAGGIARPRLGVAALNPHAGENGAFGREEIDVIAPAVEDLAAGGIDARGPFPSDTIFLRARDGEFDGVVTMFHDQGQIAVKLLGFDRGVTMAAGLAFPICTPARHSLRSGRNPDRQHRRIRARDDRGGQCRLPEARVVGRWPCPR